MKSSLKPISRKTPLKKISERRIEESKQYFILRENFLKNHPLCMVDLFELGYDPKAKCIVEKEVAWIYVEPNYHVVPINRINPATEIHHGSKRGKNYLKTETWWAVCRKNHERIENNKSWARSVGFLK
jgi:hypothetical protein